MHEGLAEVAGTRLWYWDTGGAGTPLVLCHPASQSCQIWERQRHAFVSAGYRVIAYSRRGHHRSERCDANAPGTTVTDLAELLNHINVDRAHVLGAAAGGITALGFAVANPERTASLILAGTIFAPDEPEWRDVYGRLGIAEVRAAVSTEFLELGPTYRMSEPEGTARFGELSRSSKPHGAPGQPTGVRFTWRDLQQLATPILLITGEADLYAPPPMQQLIAHHLPNCKLDTIREVGHAAYWEAPAEFNRAVVAFLRENASS